MAPTTRSSAQNSPVSKSSAAGDMPLSTTPSSTPRKVPQCSKCRRPRAGHPRSGCPYAELESPSKATQDKGSEKITVAMGSMIIASPGRVPDEVTKAAIRTRRRLSSQRATLGPSDTLLSLSTNSSEIVRQLLQPGVLDDTDEGQLHVKENVEGPKSKVVRWQETLVHATPQKIPKNRLFSRSPMPGTLIPFTPETSFASSQGTTKQENPHAPSFYESVSHVSASPVVSSPPVSSPMPKEPPHEQAILRTMSVEQREDFIAKLAHAHAATIYVLPKEDIPAISSAASALDLHPCVMIKEDDPEAEGLLILGRNPVSVQRLMDKVEEEDKRKREMKSTSTDLPTESRRVSSTLRAAAGGAVVGAVGAWAGLAFS